MTLLSIIGEDISRIIPLLHAYKNEIKQHILLCDQTPENHERAKTLQKGMQKFSAKYSLGWYTRIMMTDEDDASAINAVAKKQFQNKGNLWLNATDGYPAISILLSKLIQEDGGSILTYDHFDNDLHVISPDGSMTCQQLHTKMSLEDYIMLLNYSVVEKTTKKEILHRKDDIMSLYKHEEIFYRNRKGILAKYFKRPIQGFILNSRIAETLKKIGILNAYKRLIPSKQKMLQGDIFEEYIFWLVEELNPDDLAMGVKIDFDDQVDEARKQKRIYNEFDILLIHKNRIYTIECKFSKKLDGLEIVYKYDAIIDYFGKTSKAIIANISSNPKEHYIGMKTSSSFQHSTLRRARMGNVAVYHEEQVEVKKLQALIQDFFHMN